MATEGLLRPPSISDQQDLLSDPGGDEPFFPDTIYQRLDYLDSYALFHQQEGESYDDLSEDEEQLDLTAPPPES